MQMSKKGKYKCSSTFFQMDQEDHDPTHFFQNPIIFGSGGSYFDTFLFLRFSQFGI